MTASGYGGVYWGRITDLQGAPAAPGVCTSLLHVSRTSAGESVKAGRGAMDSCSNLLRRPDGMCG
jgi:hypothetical protein